MVFLKALVVVLVVLAGSLLTLRLTHPLPDRAGIATSVAIPASGETRLGGAFIPATQRHPGLSGIVPLVDGRDALAARAVLLQTADTSIDAQYYIWQADTTGWLLLDELRAAAERGVRVRLLLDDNGIPGLDDVLAALDAHPNLEVRLFNPFTLRWPKSLGYGFDFQRLNRRMHNKSLTIDGVSTILGGRNIGDIYFAYGDGIAYYDLDVLGVGPIAADVSADFDLYWSSASTYPAALILPPSSTGLETLAVEARAARESFLGSEYLEAIGSSPLIARTLAGEEDILEWTTATLVSDDPAKGLGRVERDALLLGQLSAILSDVENRVDLVSAYLIPSRAGSDLFKEMAETGREVRLVTNSLEATDVPVVHSAWMRYRAELAAAGVSILELRARSDRPGDAGILMGSTSSLHAKTFAFDDARIFIGSFNFDPRAAALNTEMGVLIESPKIASAMSRSLDARHLVYEVRPNGAGGIEWHEWISGDEATVHTTEPGASWSRRAFVRVGSWLPFIEWML